MNINFIVFGLIQSEIEPESTDLEVHALSTRQFDHRESATCEHYRQAMLVSYSA